MPQDAAAGGRRAAKNGAICDGGKTGGLRELCSDECHGLHRSAHIIEGII